MQRVKTLRGWDEAVALARTQRPDLPAEAFERAGELEVDWTYGDAAWFSVHPNVAAQMAEGVLRDESEEKPR